MAAGAPILCARSNRPAIAFFVIGISDEHYAYGARSRWRIQVDV